MNTLSKYAVLAATFISVAGCDNLERIKLGKGFTAKYLCSATFASELDSILVKDRFIAPKVSPLPYIWRVSINPDEKSVTVADAIFLNESAKAQAYYQGATGCTLIGTRSAEQVAQQQVTPLTPPTLDNDTPWPEGREGPEPETLPGVDYERINKAIDGAFAEPGGPIPRNTQAVLVAYKGRLIAERYALGTQPNKPFIGWSMSKSVTGTLIGILQDQGKLDINQPAPIAAWQSTPKDAITTRDILHMTSGIDFREAYAEGSDVTWMLYDNDSQLEYVASLPLREPSPDGITPFNYNTGDAVLLGGIVQHVVGGTSQNSYDFYQENLFYPSDITSAFIEYDAEGNLSSGSYVYMSPRDWLRFGQLYLQKGEWNGTQVVSREWVTFATTPSPQEPTYGAQIWLNTDRALYDRVSSDAYFFRGHQDQRVMVLPSKDLVVVRLGVTEADPTGENTDPSDCNTLFGEIADALPSSPAP